MSPTARRAFKGKDTLLDRPDGEMPRPTPCGPALIEMADTATGETFSVVWWDPALLDRASDDTRGLRRDDVIAKDARPEDVAADRARYDAWRAGRAEALQRAARPSLDVVTATEYVGAAAKFAPAATAADGGRDDIRRDDVARNVDRAALAAVTIEDCSIPGPRPAGRRFGVLVHALLAAVPVDAASDTVRNLAVLHARLLGAPDDERDAAAAAVDRALRHRVLDAARAAAAAGRPCRREAPISIVRNGTLIDGQIDLAFETAAEWHVVDFKTDAELGGAEEVYRAQVALYAEALAAITGQRAVATILRV